MKRINRRIHLSGFHAILFCVVALFFLTLFSSLEPALSFDSQSFLPSQRLPQYNISSFSSYLSFDPVLSPLFILQLKGSNLNNSYSGASPELRKGLRKQSTIKQSSLKSEIINLPILGKVNATSFSLPLITFVIALLDSFNPCAFFVLLFLLSLLVYAKNRARMFFIGLVFVFFSGMIYFLFMAAWLNFFLITKSINYITLGAGLMALFIAAVNIKDFFAFKRGISFTLSQRQRRNLLSKMRGLLRANSLFSILIGTVTLAIAANLYELLCTMGLPMIFTKILVLNKLNLTSYYLYLVFYNVIYVLPLLAIVVVFTLTLGRRKLSEAEGEALKLLSGIMMLVLGSLLVFAPYYLRNVAVMLCSMLGAGGVTALIILMRRLKNRLKNRKTKK